MSSYIYSISIDKTWSFLPTANHGHGIIGMRWYMFANDGDISFLHGPTISVHELIANPEQLQ